MKDMKDLKKLKEKEFAEKADRSKNTISLLRKRSEEHTSELQSQWSSRMPSSA